MIEFFFIFQGYKAPSLVFSSDIKDLPNKKKAENKEIHWILSYNKQSGQIEEVAKDIGLPENSHIEALKLLLEPLQSNSEKLKSIPEEQPFKRPLPVNSIINSNSGIGETIQMTCLKSASAFSEFDINLAATAKSYKYENSAVFRSDVPNCLAGNQIDLKTNKWISRKQGNDI